MRARMTGRPDGYNRRPVANEDHLSADRSIAEGRAGPPSAPAPGGHGSGGPSSRRPSPAEQRRAPAWRGWPRTAPSSPASRARRATPEPLAAPRRGRGDARHGVHRRGPGARGARRRRGERGGPDPGERGGRRPGARGAGGARAGAHSPTRPPSSRSTRSTPTASPSGGSRGPAWRSSRSRRLHAQRAPRGHPRDGGRDRRRQLGLEAWRTPPSRSATTRGCPHGCRRPCAAGGRASSPTCPTRSPRRPSSSPGRAPTARASCCARRRAPLASPDTGGGGAREVDVDGVPGVLQRPPARPPWCGRRPSAPSACRCAGSPTPRTSPCAWPARSRRAPCRSGRPLGLAGWRAVRVAPVPLLRGTPSGAAGQIADPPRLLLFAAVSDRTVRIGRPLDSEDTGATLAAGRGLRRGRRGPPGGGAERGGPRPARPAPRRRASTARMPAP